MYSLWGCVRFFRFSPLSIAHWEQRLKVGKGVVLVSEINHMAQSSSIGFRVVGVGQAQTLRDGEPIAGKVDR